MGKDQSLHLGLAAYISRDNCKNSPQQIFIEHLFCPRHMDTSRKELTVQWGWRTCTWPAHSWTASTRAKTEGWQSAGEPEDGEATQHTLSLSPFRDRVAFPHDLLDFCWIFWNEISLFQNLGHLSLPFNTQSLSSNLLIISEDYRRHGVHLTNHGTVADRERLATPLHQSLTQMSPPVTTIPVQVMFSFWFPNSVPQQDLTFQKPVLSHMRVH